MKFLSSFFIICLLCISGCNKKQEYDPFPDAENIQAKVEGFIVQKIHDGEGEYLSMTFDPQNRLLISPRYGELIRMNISANGSATALLDTVKCGVTDCQGLLYAYRSLYMMGSGPGEIRGIYRLKDLDGKGTYGTPQLLLEMPQNGDHSGHTLALGPDGMIYFLTGNENSPPTDDRIQFIHQNWETDHLMPLRSIYGSNQRPPGGFVMRTDSLGASWQFYAYGLRNPYDMCFNKEGALFTFDSDMEWDFGLPWYRPTRVNHLVSGADFAWREITAKRFDHYPDIWPAVAEFGRGSPTGTVSGHDSYFPQKYQDALFLGDWSFGKIYALFLSPRGSTYSGSIEVFATGKPLNVTDMVVGPDGALYFVTGGNGTETGLFRIIYENPLPPVTTKKVDSELVSLRKKIEVAHFTSDTSGLSMAIAYMGHQDRFIRQASRIVLEKTDPTLWRHQLNKESTINGQLNYLTAMVRCDKDEELINDVLVHLQNMDWNDLNNEQRLALQRIVTLFLVRYDTIDQNHLGALHTKLMPFYPSENILLNKELSRNLAYLATKGFGASEFIRQTIQLMESSQKQEEMIHYLEVLRKIPRGWRLEYRLAYIYWMDYAATQFRGGSLFQYFLGEIRKDFDASLTSNEKSLINASEPRTLSDDYQGPFNKKSQVRGVKTESGSFVRNWEFDDLQFSLELVNSPRNPRERDFHRGRRMFEKGLCYNCHQMMDRGGSFGPEMTYAGNSFGVEELTRTILYPSEAVNSRFQGNDFSLKGDVLISGRVLSESDAFYVISKDWTGQQIEEIPKSSVLSKVPSTTSEMPPGLVNTMEKNEILDLLYFISEIPSRKNDLMAFDIFESKTTFERGDSVLIEMVNYNDDGQLFYRINETSADFSLYQEPFYVYKTSYIEGYKMKGSSKSEIKNRMVHAYESETNGLDYVLTTNAMERFKISKTETGKVSGLARTLNIRDIVQDQDNFNLVLEGYLEVDVSGTYHFYAIYDDAVKIYINNQLIIDGGMNNWSGESDNEIILSQGRVPFKVEFYDQLSTEYLFVEYEGPGINRKEIPADKLFRKNVSL